MHLQETLPWISPLDIARGISAREDCWILLYSGLRQPFSGRYSILAMQPDNQLISDNFSEFEKVLTSDAEKFTNAWFGYLGYGLKNSLEKLPSDSKNAQNLPPLWMNRYRLILLFDHEKEVIEVFAPSPFDLLSIPKPIFDSDKTPPKVSEIRSNMTRAEYLQNVDIIKNRIECGDLSQANLTRKFSGTLSGSSPFAIFTNLCTLSPSPYSAFLKLGDNYILSSSPERFLHIDKNGVASACPIKGSAARFEDEKKDMESKNRLLNSEKDRAENLMIVDLMRNDFSRSALAGSVKVTSLYDITSHATVHHMSSTIQGEKRADVSTLEFIKNCFPPGSMTGTPKIKAMELCSELEKLERGIYSGALGWFGGDGTADLSVVIRTLIIRNQDYLSKHQNTEHQPSDTASASFEFQVGGAIVTDSSPWLEWRETLIKARAIASALNIDIEQLEVV